MRTKERRTVISIRGEDAEYLMPALREIEVKRMKAEWNKLHEGTRGHLIRMNEHPDGKVAEMRPRTTITCERSVIVATDEREPKWPDTVEHHAFFKKRSRHHIIISVMPSVRTFRLMAGDPGSGGEDVLRVYRRLGAGEPFVLEENP